jgi:pimeloyl-ACP methyl ester carboxylesterase
MMQIQRAFVEGLLAAIAVLPSPARRVERHGDRLALHACQIPRFDGTAQCGTVTVFENRRTKTGRTIDLNIVVVPAVSATPAPDPVFWLAGGPGVAATDVAGTAKGGLLGGLRRDRDLVFVDQRGTGKSNALTCDLGDDPADLQAFFGELLALDKVQRCRAELEKHADLAPYTTPIAIDDLDEVREALGYHTIDIAAASYGAIAAQVYLRQHPAQVRSVFLVGVATPGIKQPLLFARAAQHALDRLFEDCTADESCRGSFPNLKSEFDAVLARFETGSLGVDMLDPSTRQRRAVTLSRDSFVEHLRVLLYTTLGARFVPFIVHRAYGNDFIPFETMAIRTNPAANLSRGMYLTVTCSEGVPFITDKEIVDEARGTFVGENRIRVHRKACAEWPHQTVSRDFIDPVTSDRPVFMFSGEVDGSTPPWFAEEAVKYLSHSRHVQARHYGHQLDSPCLWNAASEFVAKGSGDGIDMGCAAEIRRPPFAKDVPNLEGR